MPLKFNPRTGEWDEIADSPADRISRIGTYFKGYYDSKLPDSAEWIVFVGIALIMLLVYRLSLVLGLIVSAGLFFEKTRNWLMVASWFVGLPIAFALRMAFYNRWTLVSAVLLIIGIVIL